MSMQESLSRLKGWEPVSRITGKLLGEKFPEKNGPAIAVSTGAAIILNGEAFINPNLPRETTPPFSQRNPTTADIPTLK